MEHSIKLGDCLGKGAFGSVYRVSFSHLTRPNRFLGAQLGYRTNFGRETDTFIEHTQIRSQSHNGTRIDQREILKS